MIILPSLLETLMSPKGTLLEFPRKPSVSAEAIMTADRRRASLMVKAIFCESDFVAAGIIAIKDSFPVDQHFAKKYR
jgi:hypothetical protein